MSRPSPVRPKLVWLLDDFENKELPLRKEDITREKYIEREGECSSASIGAAGLPLSCSERGRGEETASWEVISEEFSTGGFLCPCNSAVGGIFVMCLMNVAIAR
jgi:hypothetical protein